MLNSHDLADRQVIAAGREHGALNRNRYKIIKLELDRPIQREWRRIYVLTDRAKARLDSPILKGILAVIGSVKVHHGHDFLMRQSRRKKLVEIEQPLRPIPIHEWRREDYPNRWRRYFRCELLIEWNRHWQPCWVFAEPSLYELKLERISSGIPRS